MNYLTILRYRVPTEQSTHENLRNATSAATGLVCCQIVFTIYRKFEIQIKKLYLLFLIKENLY